MGCIQAKQTAGKSSPNKPRQNIDLILKTIPEQTPSQIESSPKPQKIDQLNPQESQLNRKSVSQPSLLSESISKIEKRPKVIRMNEKAINFRRETNESGLSNETGVDEVNGSEKSSGREV